MRQHSRIRTYLCLLVCAALAACLLGGCGSASGGPDDFPSAPVKVIVPFAPGGGMDLLARAVQQYVDLGGQTMVITNIEGGNSSIGSMEVFNADPDGYTILCSAVETIMGYNIGGVLDSPVEEYTQIATLVYDGHVVSVSKDSPFQSMQDIIDYAREHPGELLWGGTGSKGSNEQASAEIWQKCGIDVTYVPYDSGAKTRTAGMGGHTDVTFCQISEIKAVVDSGDMVPVGVLTAERSVFFPDCPTFMEMGYDIDNGLHRGFFAPPDTPQEIIDVLEAAFKEVYDNPDFVAALAEEVGFEAEYVGSKELEQLIEERYPIQLALYDFVNG